MTVHSHMRTARSRSAARGHAWLHQHWHSSKGTAALPLAEALQCVLCSSARVQVQASKAAGVWGLYPRHRPAAPAAACRCTAVQGGAAAALPYLHGAASHVLNIV